MGGIRPLLSAPRLRCGLTSGLLRASPTSRLLLRCLETFHGPSLLPSTLCLRATTCGVPPKPCSEKPVARMTGNPPILSTSLDPGSHGWLAFGWPFFGQARSPLAGNRHVWLCCGNPVREQGLFLSSTPFGGRALVCFRPGLPLGLRRGPTSIPREASLKHPFKRPSGASAVLWTKEPRASCRLMWPLSLIRSGCLSCAALCSTCTSRPNSLGCWRTFTVGPGVCFPWLVPCRPVGYGQLWDSAGMSLVPGACRGSVPYLGGFCDWPYAEPAGGGDGLC